jgi:dTDP-4-amino-4,6-dideoxygalactose transaminase
MSHEDVFNTLRENGIGVNLHYIPVHLHPFYKNLGFKDGDYPESEKYSSEAISIPIHHSLTRKDQNYVIKILKKILK